MKTLKIMMVALMMTIATSVSAMTYSEAKSQALFLADKMAYELNLSEEQYEAVYEINLDYLMALDDYGDAYGTYWSRRNAELESVLAAWQYENYIATTYFYRPVYWSAGRWNWRIYSHYAYNCWFNSRPRVYVTYRGGNNRAYYASRSWHADNRTVARRVVNNRNNSVATANHSFNNRVSNVNSGNRNFGNLRSNNAVRTNTVKNVRNISTNNRTANRSFGKSTAPAKVSSSKANGSRSFGRGR